MQENQNVEYKESWRDEYLKWICGFANARRSGSTKQELSGTALQDFLYKKIGLTWDGATYTNATIECIDENAINYFIKKAVDSGRLPSGFSSSNILTILENLDLITEDKKLKNAAILCFAKRPSKYFPCCEFKIARFGRSQSDLIFQDMVEGNIIQMADKVIDILKSKYLINPIHYEGLQRIEKLEIPESSLRELIFNAIIHNWTPILIQCVSR